ncbi:hypothetical protein VNI00_012375 [Paramarasmius palmivorus]|uniref:F-box domain-containing protein n=1 Tax=Paramarasmius palmivorus TaxID=297713 RepID=A0AAW0C613_9AGAR
MDNAHPWFNPYLEAFSEIFRPKDVGSGSRFALSRKRLPTPPTFALSKHHMAEQLSQELIDRILDILYEEDNDEEAIEACSLVSWKWLFRARYHTFSLISVKAPARTSSQVSRYKKLVTLLSSPHCTLQSRTRTLYIEGPSRDCGAAFKPTIANWMDPLFERISRWKLVTSLSLKNVEDQTLRSEAWKSLTSDGEDAICFRSRIIRLTLHQFPVVGQDDDLIQLLTFVHAFPSIQYLSFTPFTRLPADNVPYSAKAGGVRKISGTLGLGDAHALALAQSAPPAPVTVKELELGSIQGSNGTPFFYSLLFEWFRLGGISLRSLHVHLGVMHGSDLHSFARYLDFVSPSLERLELVAPSYEGDLAETMDFGVLMDARNKHAAKFKSLFEYRPFAQCAALQELTIERLFLYELFNGTVLSLIPIDTVISGICGHSLKHLRLEVCTELADDKSFDSVAENNAWRRADTLLAGNAFPALESVVISISVVVTTLFGQYFDSREVGRQRKTFMVPYFQSVLPKCHGKGILKFAFKPIDLGWR